MTTKSSGSVYRSRIFSCPMAQPFDAEYLLQSNETIAHQEACVRIFTASFFKIDRN